MFGSKAECLQSPDLRGGCKPRTFAGFYFEKKLKVQPFHRTTSICSHFARAPTSPEVTPPSNKSARNPNLGSLFIVKASLLDVLLRTTKHFPFLRSSSRHSTAPGKATSPSSCDSEGPDRPSPCRSLRPSDYAHVIHLKITLELPETRAPACTVFA